MVAWWGSVYWPSMEDVSKGSFHEEFLVSLEAETSKPRPSGENICNEEMTCVPDATWRQLVAAKVVSPPCSLELLCWSQCSVVTAADLASVIQDQIKDVAGLRHRLAESERWLKETRRQSSEVGLLGLPYMRRA